MRGARRDPGRWISASDLAEYAYCPRAWWYRSHPPARGPSMESRRSSAQGVAFHDRHLRAAVDRDRWVWAWVGVAVLAVALLAAAVWFGGGA